MGRALFMLTAFALAIAPVSFAGSPVTGKTENHEVVISGESAAVERDPHPNVRIAYWGDLPPGDRPEPGPLWADGDILVYGSGFFDVTPAMAGDSQGDLFCAFEKQDPAGTRIRTQWSHDGGQTWMDFSEVWSPSGYDLLSPSLAVGEGGDHDWVICTFIDTQLSELYVFMVNLDTHATEVVKVDSNAVGICNPQIVTDAAEYSNWYPYVVYNSKGPDSWLLRFSRSTDYGATWDAPTTLHAYSGAPDPYYNAEDAYPDVEFGSGYLYAAFDDYPSGGDGSTRDVYVMQSADFGGSWSAAAPIAITSLDEFAPRLGAVKSYPAARTVVAGYTKFYGGLDWDVWYSYTVDGGATWNLDHCLACDPDRLAAVCDLATSYIRGRIHAAYYDNGTVVYTYAPYGDPTAWAPLVDASDPGVVSLSHPRPAVGIVRDRPIDEEAGVAWTDERAYDLEIYFDGPGVLDAGVDVGGRDSEDAQAAGCNPNPFTASTTVSFTLTRPVPVKAGIYDVSGRLVRLLVDSARIEPGEQQLKWDGCDDAGQPVGPGVYFLKIATPEGHRQSKVIVLK